MKVPAENVTVPAVVTVFAGVACPNVVPVSVCEYAPPMLIVYAELLLPREEF